ncbi:MAG: hypothetical protein QGH33_03645, partial [Pirellulaceae bacterium]|nr:hypothetical protein [Pirellulaceae bacterium]
PPERIFDNTLLFLMMILPFAVIRKYRPVRKGFLWRHGLALQKAVRTETDGSRFQSFFRRPENNPSPHQFTRWPKRQHTDDARQANHYSTTPGSHQKE